MSQSFFHIQFAEESHESAVTELQAAARLEAENYRGTVPEPNSPTHTVVALVEHSVVGFATLIVQDSVAEITAVHVHANAREAGIADALLHFVIDYCQKSDVRWISGSAQPGDRALKNLFERHGLVAQRITVGKSLSDPSTEERASR